MFQIACTIDNNNNKLFPEESFSLIECSWFFITCKRGNLCEDHVESHSSRLKTKTFSGMATRLQYCFFVLVVVYDRTVTARTISNDHLLLKRKSSLLLNISLPDYDTNNGNYIDISTDIYNNWSNNFTNLTFRIVSAEIELPPPDALPLYFWSSESLFFFQLVSPLAMDSILFGMRICNYAFQSVLLTLVNLSIPSRFFSAWHIVPTLFNIAALSDTAWFAIFSCKPAVKLLMLCQCVVFTRQTRILELGYGRSCSVLFSLSGLIYAALHFIANYSFRIVDTITTELGLEVKLSVVESMILSFTPTVSVMVIINLFFLTVLLCDRDIDMTEHFFRLELQYQHCFWSFMYNFALWLLGCFAVIHRAWDLWNLYALLNLLPPLIYFSNHFFYENKFPLPEDVNEIFSISVPTKLPTFGAMNRNA